MRSLVVLAVLFAPSTVRGEEPAPAPPPRLTDLRDHTIRVGKPLAFVVNAWSAPGTTVTIATKELPRGATFDADVRELRWTPGPDQVGEHRVWFLVSDGTNQAAGVAILRVTENRPPVGRVYPDTARYQPGRPLRFRLAFEDPDGDPVTVDAAGLPESAHLDRATGVVDWTPSDDEDRRFAIRATASDGLATSTPLFASFDLVEEWGMKWLPGVYFTSYLPASDETLGEYVGVTAELVLYSWMRRNQNRGPSHGRFYLRGAILRSTRDDTPTTLIYAAGIELSIERHPKRHWLLPFYGIDVGGLVQDPTGHAFQVTPHVGVHLVSTRSIELGVTAGYLVAPSRLEEYRGWTFSAGGTLTLW